MKKTTLTLLMQGLLFSAFAQDISGEWFLVDLQKEDSESYLEVKWEFTESRCYWKTRSDEDILFQFSYSILRTACDGEIDGDKHLSLENEEGEQCYVILGIENKDGRTTMSLVPYGVMEPILLVKK